MRQRIRTFIALGAAAALGLGTTAAIVGSAEAAATQALGLSSNGVTLKTFSLSTGKQIKSLGSVKGLTDGDTKLVGIDQRIQDKKFYGVGNNGGIYTLSTVTGVATKVQSLSVDLVGSRFGVDFNPAANALRIVSNTGQNLRFPFAGATPFVTMVDTPLNFTNSAVPPVTTNPQTGITAVAYTNNDLSAATGTALFDLDMTGDRLFQQTNANAGTLALVGAFGVAQSEIAGFDIVSTNSGDRTVSNIGYVTLRPSAPGSRGALFKIDLLSGKTTKVANFTHDVAALAIPQG